MSNKRRFSVGIGVVLFVAATAAWGRGIDSARRAAIAAVEGKSSSGEHVAQVYDGGTDNEKWVEVRTEGTSTTRFFVVSRGKRGRWKAAFDEGVKSSANGTRTKHTAEGRTIERKVSGKGGMHKITLHQPRREDGRFKKAQLQSLELPPVFRSIPARVVDFNSGTLKAPSRPLKKYGDPATAKDPHKLNNYSLRQERGHEVIMRNRPLTPRRRQALRHRALRLLRPHR